MGKFFLVVLGSKGPERERGWSQWIREGVEIIYEYISVFVTSNNARQNVLTDFKTPCWPKGNFLGNYTHSIINSMNILYP